YTYSSRSNVVTTTTRVRPEVMRRAASRPATPGIRMATRTTSGASPAASAPARPPPAAPPPTAGSTPVADEVRELGGAGGGVAGAGAEDAEDVLQLAQGLAGAVADDGERVAGLGRSARPVDGFGGDGGVQGDDGQGVGGDVVDFPGD